MKTKIHMRKRLGSLHPVDECDREALKTLPDNQIVRVEISQARNVNQLRLYWALIEVVQRTLPEKEALAYPTKESFSDACKIMAGHREMVVLPPNGKVQFKPRSIAFDKLSQADFNRFFDSICHVIGKFWLPNVTNAELRRQAESMIGEPESGRAA